MDQGSVAKQAKAWVEAGATLLDVRTPAEFSAGHLPGAKNIPLHELPERAGELGPPERTRLVVYCHIGPRADRACEFLQHLGFKEILNLRSMLAWAHADEGGGR